MIHKQILEAVNTIRIGDNPIATGAWNIAAMAVKFCCPNKVRGPSSPLILEEKVSLQRRASREGVVAEIEYVIVILPSMVAWRVIRSAPPPLPP